MRRTIPKRDRFHTVAVKQVGDQFQLIGHYGQGDNRAPVLLSTHSDALNAERALSATARQHNAYETVEYND
jgi:hypothetical protein